MQIRKSKPRISKKCNEQDRFLETEHRDKLLKSLQEIVQKEPRIRGDRYGAQIVGLLLQVED